MTKITSLSIALLAGVALAACDGSSSTCGDAGCPDASTDAAKTLFGLSAGDNCYTITAITAGYSDGCKLGVQTLVGMSLPMNYTAATATVMLGTEGSLGAGVISANMGTLVRENDPTLDTTGVCGWHQLDTSLLKLTADNKFTVTVTEVESMFKAGCTADITPTGGTCTSTWTWTMQKATDASLTPPLCGALP